MDKPIHRPHGNMCVNCEKLANDCSKLNFSTMKPIKVDSSGNIVVACHNFERFKGKPVDYEDR